MKLRDLHWLPESDALKDTLRQFAAQATVPWSDITRVAGLRLDFVQTSRLDRVLQKTLASADHDAAPWRRLRLAVLSSSTTDHLLPALRIAAARRNLLLDTWTGDYGLYMQEVRDAGSALYQAKPDVLLFALHAQHLLGNPNPSLDAAAAAVLVEDCVERIRANWRAARRHFHGQIVQQSVLPLYPALAGLNEGRLPGSGASLVARINARLAEIATEDQVDLLDLAPVIANDGLYAWHDPVLWHRAKQEISPSATPAYGDLVLRLIGAQAGRSAKCLVLDLDNTLWGGVIGDDGLEGIKLGQGSALGEAYVEFQQYAKALGRRGVILAVCSKNDEDNAKAPFLQHPDMVLKLEDIACFVANWTDKASNLRHIAETLNIGLDALVFVDDNPFERNIIRRELPMVSVPEVPEDPVLYAACVAQAGYFEALQVTQEDFERGGQYRANVARESLRAAHTDLEGYLRSLNMELRWAPFDAIGLQRIVQLINKTNQFNLTTRRYTEAEVQQIMTTPGALTLQLRLIDDFGDNGIIAIIIGKPTADGLHLDTWLMSCRVLGRQVEEATLNLIAEQARALGADCLLGEYLPTKKNGMVREHYRKLGFECTASADDGHTRWRRSLQDFQPFPTFIRTHGGTH